MLIYCGVAVCWFLLSLASSVKRDAGVVAVAALFGLAWPVLACVVAGVWAIGLVVTVLLLFSGWDPGGPDHGSNA